jgi:hypothetical protein
LKYVAALGVGCWVLSAERGLSPNMVKDSAQTDAVPCFPMKCFVAAYACIADSMARLAAVVQLGTALCLAGFT